MNFTQINQRFLALQQQYPKLASWSIKLDRARRRAGACYVQRKMISISAHHIELNSEATIIDTLLHEVAHALAYEHDRITGHGPLWRKWVKRLGGQPEVTGRFKVPDAPWMLVHLEGEELRPIAPRHRRNRSIKHFMMRGRPDTRGQLFYVDQVEFERWHHGELSLTDVTLIQ